MFTLRGLLASYSNHNVLKLGDQDKCTGALGFAELEQLHVESTVCI